MDRVRRFVEDRMAEFDDPCHDFLHVQRVVKLAMDIARSEARKGVLGVTVPDCQVVEAAAYLHDVMDHKFKVKHTPADIRELLKGVLDDGRIDLVLAIIENTSYSHERRLAEAGQITEFHRTCLELHCVQDADRLDAVGAIGILRVAAFSGVRNRALVDPAQPFRDTAFRHFYDKLLRVQYAIKTQRGKELALERQRVMETFLHDLHHEVF